MTILRCVHRGKTKRSTYPLNLYNRKGARLRNRFSFLHLFIAGHDQGAAPRGAIWITADGDAEITGGGKQRALFDLVLS